MRTTTRSAAFPSPYSIRTPPPVSRDVGHALDQRLDLLPVAVRDPFEANLDPGWPPCTGRGAADAVRLPEGARALAEEAGEGHRPRQALELVEGQRRERERPLAGEVDRRAAVLEGQDVGRRSGRRARSVVVSAVSAKAIVRRRVGLPCRWRRLTWIKVSTRPKPRAKRGNDQGTLRASGDIGPRHDQQQAGDDRGHDAVAVPGPGRSSSPSSAACPIGAPRSAQYRTRKATTGQPPRPRPRCAPGRSPRTRPVMPGEAPGP